MKYYLYNSKANNGILPAVDESIKLIDAVGIDYPAFLDKLNPEDEVVLAGGDGTLNYFVNHTKGYNYRNNIYLLAAGTGNDFAVDLNHQSGDEILVNQYLTNLPTVKVNGLEQLFLNNMGFGIDGYCCEEADRIKAKTPNKKINYTMIAIKGLLFRFKPKKAMVKVDGQTYQFDNVWIAPTMKGRYYGGGMMMAPDQNRNSDKVTLVIYMSSSKIKALAQFPSIFKGEHVKNTEMVKFFTGNHIEVEFDSPCAAQIDGETVLNVTHYQVDL